MKAEMNRRKFSETFLTKFEMQCSSQAQELSFRCDVCSSRPDNRMIWLEFAWKQTDFLIFLHRFHDLFVFFVSTCMFLISVYVAACLAGEFVWLEELHSRDVWNCCMQAPGVPFATGTSPILRWVCQSKVCEC